MAVLTACICCLSGCDNQAQQIEASGKTVRIGLIAPFSGPEEEWGPICLLGSKVALKLQPYLSNGDKPEIITADDGNSPEQSKAALKKLIEVDKVAAVLISSDSVATLAAVEDADHYQTPILALLASHPEVGDANWVTQFVFDDSFQGNIAALYVRDEMFIEQAAVFTDPDNPHSQFLAAEFARKFKETDGLVETISLETVRDDLSSVINRLHAAKVEFLYLPLSADQVIKIELAMRDIDWNPKTMVSDGVLSAIRLQYEDKLDLVDGMLATEIYSTTLTPTPYGKKASEVYRDSPDAKKNTFAALACEGTSIILAAMNGCRDSADKECLNRRLRNSGDFTGLFDIIRINSNGKTDRPVYINTINGNEMKFLVKVY